MAAAGGGAVPGPPPGGGGGGGGGFPGPKPSAVGGGGGSACAPNSAVKFSIFPPAPALSRCLALVVVIGQSFPGVPPSSSARHSSLDGSGPAYLVPATTSVALGVRAGSAV